LFCSCTGKPPLSYLLNALFLILTNTYKFFFNFGPNATTFIIPAEVFPSRVRGFSHGLSAAVGKFGAILSALLFNYLSGPTVIGLPNVLWIFFACNVLGATITFFLIPETKNRDADVIDYQEWQEANAIRLKKEQMSSGSGNVEASGTETEKEKKPDMNVPAKAEDTVVDGKNAKKKQVARLE
jgi:hypothetical protein